MNNNKIYFWACDYSPSTGEGRLGRLFVKFLEKKSIPVKISNTHAGILDYKYISPFVGIIYCWLFFFKKKKVAYINYLPLWNSIIYLLLPPKTILGPITGGSNFSRSNKDYIARKYIFPLLYKISEAIIILRFKNIIFSTDLLKKNLSSYILSQSKFNFVLKALKVKKKYTKINDFCLYYRKHPTKISNYPFSFIRKLISQGFEIQVVGDRLNIIGVKNLGFIEHQKLMQILKKTKFTISSPENIYTLFLIDCVNSNVKILIDSKKINNNRENSKNFIKHDFKKKFLP